MLAPDLYGLKRRKSTSYFLNIEKNQQTTNNTINKINDENGIEYTTTVEIIDVLINFYDKL